jgi:hypothetical protein
LSPGSGSVTKSGSGFRRSGKIYKKGEKQPKIDD